MIEHKNKVIMDVEEFDMLETDLAYQKKNMRLFSEENKILKSELYSLRDKYDDLIKRVENAEELKDRVIEILATSHAIPIGVVSQLEEALGEAIE